jgi:MEDS: MEthanogen/methylotroph, DcmR Sensory domain
VTQRAPWEALLDRPRDGQHAVQLSSDPAFLADAVARFAAVGLRGGEGIVLVARRERWDAIQERLVDEGLDPRAAIERGQLHVWDATTLLDAFLVDGRPDAAAFEGTVARRLDELALRYPKIRAFGEMVDVLWQRGDRDAAIGLEAIWNETLRRRASHLSLLCAYSIDPLSDDAYGGPIESICQAHSHLIPARSYERLDEAVALASHEVLDGALASMMQSLSAVHRPRTEMPLGQATLVWLKENMPATAERILRGVRERCATSTSSP